MQAAIEKYINKRKLNNDVFRGHTAIAVLLSFAVVIGVFWWLKLVGITMAGEAFCGFTEHTHTEECMSRTLICELEDNDAHTHTDGCYNISYICGKEEHIHVPECYSDTSADLESKRIWEATLDGLTPNFNLAEDIIAVAKTQLGYKESTLNFKVDEDNVKRGYTRYGEWYGNPYGGWSATFIGFCMHYAGISHEDVPYYSGVETMRLEWENADIYRSIDSYNPGRGDILFLDEDGDGKAEYAGIVTEADGTDFSVIIGDYGDEVAEIELSANDARLIGASVMTEMLTRMADDLTKWRVDLAIEEINDLTPIDVIFQNVMQFYELDDSDAYADYVAKHSLYSLSAYARWEDLGVFKPLVHNSAVLEPYSSLWMSTLAALDSPTVYQINKYSQAVTTAVSGSGTIRDVMGSGMAYTNWNMYIVAQDSNGYYLKQYVGSGTPKWDYTIGNGFVLLMYQNTWSNVKVGDRVAVTFPVTGEHSYNSAGYGSVSVTTLPTEPEQNLNLTPLAQKPGNDVADTYDYIEVNLYNYGNSINSKYNSNKNYPGFQQEFGTTSIGERLTSGSFNFGNNITADYDAGLYNITNKGGDINKTANGANTPISGYMNYNLSAKGYPQLLYTASGFDSELWWLFSTNESTSTTKMNTDNINGLFRVDENGIYSFDSRVNHAQFNASTNTFDLYDEHLTPNYIMYPFGNFLPLNNINTQSTKVTDINQNYFNSLKQSALLKYQSTGKKEYNTLSSVLGTFVTRMGGTFDYLAPVNKYFETAGVPTDNGGSTTGVFGNMYNLDYDEASDFYYGMDIHMTFMMPKNGMTGTNGDIPLYFDFNGDDDVWVYVDNKLFLDLSGIHRHVGGRIDFQLGIVNYYQFNPATGEADILIYTATFEQLLGVDAAAANLVYVKDGNGNQVSVTAGDHSTGETSSYAAKTFPNYSNHSFDFFYMERGSGSSVCKMEFTLPLLQKNSISVTKELDSDDDLTVIGNPDFKFQILKADLSKTGDAQYTEIPFIDAGVEYTIRDLNGNIVGTGITLANGIFTLKAGQVAEFAGIEESMGSYYVRELLDTTVFEQYDIVAVDGKTDTTYNDVVIGQDTFVGVRSPIKDISNGNTTFTFINHVDVHKYGSIEISKNFRDYQNTSPLRRPVDFQLWIDGMPVPVGTEYIIIQPDGTEVTAKITEAGRLTFYTDQRVLFHSILAGTKIAIREYASSSNGYDVNFVPSESLKITITATDEGKKAECLIPSGTSQLTVNNDREGTKLDINVLKSLLYPDGTPHSYELALVQITSLTDTSPMPDKYPIYSPVTVTNDPVPTLFTLNYAPGTADGTFYYLIYEKDADAALGMDLTEYIIEVTVTDSDTGKPKAAVTGVYRGGDRIADTVTVDSPVTFINTNVRDLTVKKTVIGVTADDVEFTFTIVATVDGTMLNGIYPVSGHDSITEVEFRNGVATVKLKHGQALTVKGLPYGTAWTVTETHNGGFYTQYSVDGSEYLLGNEAKPAAGVTLTENAEVHFINVGSGELPSTGSAGQLMYIYAGIAIMAVSLICGFILRRKSERRTND